MPIGSRWPRLRLLARTGIDTTLRGKADPSDLVQETMLKASMNFNGFRGHSEAELAAWLPGRGLGRG